MAYSKHTWVARQGVGLNKFTDQNGVKYEFTPSPDEVTQPGTPFSAEWMNEMEEQLAKAAVLSGGAVEGNFPMFNALGELINSGKGPNILQYVNGMFSTLDGKLLDIGNAKIETGSYVGTGTPPTLTFSFTPKALIIISIGQSTVNAGKSGYYSFLAIMTPEGSIIQGTGGSDEALSAGNRCVVLPYHYETVAFVNKSVSWIHDTGIQAHNHSYTSAPGKTYDLSSASEPNLYHFYKGCRSGVTYHYTAIG